MFSTGVEGNLSHFETHGREIDYALIEWFDASKHVLRLPTQAGREIGIRKPEGAALCDGDVLYHDEDLIVAVRIKRCPALRVRLHDPVQAARLGYELGNLHLPVSITNDVLEVPFDEPTEQHLVKLGYLPERVECIFQGHMPSHHHHE